MDDRSEIVRLLPPPTKKFGAEGDWAAAEQRLGSAFPDDYKWFIETYGAGTISTWLWIFSPFGQVRGYDFWESMEVERDNFHEYYKDGQVKNPLSIFPEPGGLLMFGGTENANDLSWKTDGQPNEWYVVIYNSSHRKFLEFKGMSLSTFLLGILRDKEPFSDLFAENWLAKRKRFIAEIAEG